MSSYTLPSMKSNSLRGSSIQTVPSIELKFGMYIIDHHFTHCIDFVEFKINSFLQECEKEFSCITAYRVKL